MKRYRSKPIRFWLANFLVAPLAGSVASIVWMSVLLYVFRPIGAIFDWTGFSVVLQWVALLHSYWFGFFVTAAYALALALWQHRRKGHTIIEAAVIGWLALAATWSVFKLLASLPAPFDGWYLLGGAVVLPLLWFVCLWSGITYRLKTEPVSTERIAA